MTSSLRIKIAESLGWKLWPIVGLVPPGTEPPFTLNSYPPCPDWSGDPSAALQLVDALAEQGWRPIIEKGEKQWYCKFWLHSRPDCVRKASAPTFPEAIALAYCKVRGINTNEQET